MGWGGAGGKEKIWRDAERVGAERKGLTLFTAMQLWSAFEPDGVLWQPLLLPLSQSLSVL